MKSSTLTNLASAVVALLAMTAFGEASSQSVDVVIETRIKNKTASFQAGIKSTQTINVNFSTKAITQVFFTGVTNLVGIQLKSVRDKFTVSNKKFAGMAAGFWAAGQTASGVVIMPNINYNFDITVDMVAKEIVLSGCHDGYPSYRISIDGKLIYDFDQELLVALFGNCDINVPTTTRKF